MDKYRHSIAALESDRYHRLCGGHVSARSPLVTLGATAGLLLALIWALLRSGFTMSPVPEDLVAAAQIWPSRTASWMTEFYADSPLYIFSSRLFGISDTIGLIRQSLIVGIIALLSLALWAWCSTQTSQRNRAARLVVLAPVGGVLFSSIGNYDAFTALAWSVVLWLWLTRSRVALAAGGGILGIQHFEQTLLGVLALTLTWLAIRQFAPPAIAATSPLWIVPGVIAGKGVLLLFMIAGGHSASGRSQWLSTYVLDWTKVGIATLPYLVWSLFAGVWLLVILVWLRADIRAKSLLVGAFTLGIAGTIVSGDRPRVFVQILLPSLILLIVVFLRAQQSTRVESMSVEIMAWLAPPIILAGKSAANANVFDNAYVSFMWITGLGGPG